MMPNINPRQMQQMMRKMGISQTDIDAFEVVIKCEDKNIVIKNPSVQKVNMGGSINYQISGQESIEEASTISEDDIKTVMQQANVDKETAKEALEESEGDIAQAILNLTSEE